MALCGPSGVLQLSKIRDIASATFFGRRMTRARSSRSGSNASNHFLKTGRRIASPDQGRTIWLKKLGQFIRGRRRIDGAASSARFQSCRSGLMSAAAGQEARVKLLKRGPVDPRMNTLRPKAPARMISYSRARSSFGVLFGIDAHQFPRQRGKGKFGPTLASWQK